jgi:hypothetical protein
MSKTKKAERDVMSVPEAGARLGLARNASYRAAALGHIPTIRVGNVLRVPKVAFARLLDQAGPGKTGMTGPICGPK